MHDHPVIERLSMVLSLFIALILTKATGNIIDHTPSLAVTLTMV